MQQLNQTTKIDMTAMLDVVFIMLIFFIVTASFVLETGIDLAPPEPSTQQIESNPDAILVNITANNRYLFGQEVVDLRLLRAQFERRHAANVEAPVVIVPSPSSSTDALVTLMDAARQAGIMQIKFAQYE